MRALSNPVPADPQSTGTGRVMNPLASLRKHRLAAALVFGGVVLAGLPYAWIKGKSVFRAEGVLYVSPRVLRNLDSDQEQELQSNSQYREFVQQQVRTINRYDILASVLKQPAIAKLWRKPNETERHSIERLQTALDILPVADTYQVTVALEGEKAPGLAEVVNGVLNEFTAVAQREMLWDADGRMDKLRQEQANVSAEIAGLMERKTHMSGELGTTVFNDAMINTYDKRLSGALDALEEARRQRFAAEDALSGKAAPGLAASALDKAMNDSGLTSLKGTLNQRKAYLLTSIQGLSPQHAGRIAAEKEMKEIDDKIAQATAELHSSMQSNLHDIQQSRFEQAQLLEQQIQKDVDSLRGQAEAYSRGYQTTLEIGDEISRLQKRLDATEDRISFLSVESKSPGFVRVFSPARVPELPFQGGRKKLFLMVLAAALALAAVVPIALDTLDPRIMTERELEALLAMPVSGALTGAALVEGARRLAVVLHRHAEALPKNAVVFTGVSAHSDSTATALATGNALRALGLRPLVIEAKPAAAGSGDKRYRGRQERPGLAELLSGDASLEECILNGNAKYPDRIATGGNATVDCLLPADPILGILEDAARSYDVVLIDAAPVARSLASEEFVRLTGAVLLVAEAEKDTRAELKKTMTLLERLQPPAFGAVLSGSGAAPISHHQQTQANWKENDTPSLLAA